MCASTAYVKNNLTNYLPMTGGTVTGDVNINGNSVVGGIIVTGNARARQWYTTDTTNGYYYLTIGVDDWDLGSRIQLMTADSPNDPSVIALTAGTNQLQIRKDSFIAGGRHIVRSVNGVGAGTDGNVVLSSGVPTGTILPFCGTSAPSGCLSCNGGAISRKSYSALFKLIGTAYGAGNGSTTFNLPNMHHRFLEGTTTTSEVNTYVSAGLPNITGFYHAFGNNDSVNECRGAFANDGYTLNVGVVTGYIMGGVRYYFLASRSNATFGNSESVQPNSTRIIFIIRF